MIPLPNQSGTYTGNTRGYWFQAPTDFTITGVRVPTTASTNNQHIEVVRFNSGAPPAFATTTNNFTSLARHRNIAGTGTITVNIPVSTGDYIGILGSRGTTNSYGPKYTSNIDGKSVTLTRMGMQYQLATTNARDLWQEANGSISRVEMYYTTYTYQHDAGVIAIDSPVSPISPGTNSVVVDVKNFGWDTLKSATVGWSINGVKQTAYSWTGSLLKDSIDAGITLGSYNFALGTHIIKAWTESPNGVLDSNAVNDTSVISINCCITMSGTYSIDPSGSGDYTTISAAVADLYTCGISGSVTFNIEPGTYSEQVHFNGEVIGASATNTITLDGLSKDSVFVESGLTSVIKLNGVDYVMIKNMTVENTGTSSTDRMGISMIKKANHNMVENCHVKMNTTYYRSVAILLADYEYIYSYTRNDYNTIKDTETDGAYYGIRINGMSTADPALGNKVIGCDIQSQYYGVYFYYNRFYELSNTKSRVNGGYYPAYLYYGGDGNVHKNDLLGRYALRMYYENYYYGDSTMVTNNIVQGDFYTYRMGKSRVYHNTFRAAYYGYYCPYWTNGLVYNNIFDATTTSYRACYNYGGWSGDFNNNIWYGTGQTFYVNGNHYDPFDALNALGQGGKENWNEKPEFVSPTGNPADLHLNSSFQPRYGNGVGVLDDFDGDARCLWGPTVGADESKYPVPPPVANFATDDTICYNKFTVFNNTNGPEKKMGHFWYVNGQFVEQVRDLSYKFTQLGYDTIKLVSYSCGGVDSIEKIVVVDTPTVISTPEFLADRYIIEAAESVYFTDLSTDCPLNWEWQVFPDSVYDVSLSMMMPSVAFGTGSPYVQNPEMIFTYPGKYDVCLWVDNGQGMDSICKKDYITVKAAYNMCDFAGPDITQSEIGLLFDDGGKTGNYGTNRNCDLLLEPCATSMTLTFEEFDVANGDYLKIYDDQGGNELWDVSVYPNGLTGITSVAGLGQDTIINSPTGKLYIVWTTNGSTNRPGFKAEWTSVPSVSPVPTAMFTAPDTACVGDVVFFDGTATGDNLIYEWDMTNSGFPEAFTEDVDYQYLFAGSYMVKFTVSSVCNPQSATYSKGIVITQPSTAPAVDFMADNKEPVVMKSLVTLEDMSQGCADSWEWMISPSTFTGVTGFPDKKMAYVRFHDTGCYDVSLVVGYQGNYDTLKKPCYIRPMNYCEPAVISTNPDIGISRVAIGTIDNRTSIGMDKYTSYLSTHSTNLELQAKYPITIERNSVNNGATRKVWIDWNRDGDFDDTLELVIHEQNAKTLVYNDIIEVPSFATPGYSIMRVAISLGNLGLGICGPITFGEVEDYEVVISPDRTAPDITLIGMETVTLNQCDAYVDSGATAMDNIDGNVTSGIVTTNNLNTSIPGTYTYRYNVSDMAGNDAMEVVRTIVVNPDTIGPEVTVLGDIIDSVEVYNSWADTGYAVVERCVTVVSQGVTGMVDTSMVGMYEITYSATDSLGNVTEAIRTVYVVDLTDPVLTLNGNAVDSVEVFGTYTDMGVVITDNYYSGLTATVTGTVNTNVVGDYTIEYSVTDGSGNGPVVITRTVKVVDTEAPMISSFLYNDGDSITLEVNSQFFSPKFNVSDNYYTTLTETESGDFYTNFPNGKITNLGVYTYVFTAEDGSGNMSTFTLYIKGVDTERPVITLVGDPTQRICRFETLQNTATVSDNFDQGLQIVEGGTYVDEYLVDMAPGYYYVTYDATDNSGNEAYQKSSTVIVYDIGEEGCVSGVEENSIAKAVSIYPNPSKGSVNVSVTLDQATDLDIVVTNTLGQVVYKTVEYNVSTQVINLDLDLSNGMYNIKVQSTEGSAIFPIVIAK